MGFTAGASGNGQSEAVVRDDHTPTPIEGLEHHTKGPLQSVPLGPTLICLGSLNPAQGRDYQTLVSLVLPQRCL